MKFKISERGFLLIYELGFEMIQMVDIFGPGGELGQGKKEMKNKATMK